jgi:uncharacterized membrane protein YdbT with pleckstrin-like domain
MSMRLVKKQLAALSKSTASVPEGSSEKKALKAKDKVQKKRTKKKAKAQQKEAEEKGLSEEEVRQRNIAYYARTASGGKASELMIQVCQLEGLGVVLLFGGLVLHSFTETI